MIKKTNLFVIVLFIPFLLHAQNTDKPKRTLSNKITCYNQAQIYYTQAHEAFAHSDYDAAITCYQKVDDYISLHPEHARYFDHEFRNYSIVDMVQRRKALGTVNPKCTHRVLVIFINKVSATYKGKQVETTMTDKIKKKTEISGQVCNHLSEVLSAGELAIKFDTISINSTLTCIDETDTGDGLQAADRFIYSLTPYPGKLLLDEANNYDSFLFVWNPNDLHGKTVYKGPHGWGGTNNLVFHPYINEGPIRGRLLISAGLIDRPGTIFHELFHTLEKSYNISPIHGFKDENRKHFPEWKGKGEMEYYQYHFTDILNNKGFYDICLAKKSPMQAKFVEVANSMQHISISLDDRKKAENIIKKASEKNEENFHAAIQLNPYSPKVLLNYAIFLHNSNRKAEALKQVKTAYQQSPYNAEICYWLGVEYYHANQKEEAINFMKQALILDSNMTKAQNYLDFMQSR